MKRLCCALLLASGAAAAHQTSVSFSELDVDGAHVHGTLRFQKRELSQTQPLESFVLKTSAGTCTLQPGSSRASEGEEWQVFKADWRCPARIGELSVRLGFLDALPIGHTHLSRIRFGSETIERAAQAEDPGFDVRPSQTGTPFLRFLRLGIEHIFTGYDHICFLIGLLLLGGSLRRLIGIVTAFTAAHSITLALAALGILTPSPRFIEPLIAASIVFVGVEDLWALRKGASERALRHRWMLTFGFGLVHGFGFASALRELDLPRSALAQGLVSFNLGVECGQLAIVALLYPLLRKLLPYKYFAPAAALCVSAAGAFWLVQRLLTPG